MGLVEARVIRGEGYSPPAKSGLATKGLSLFPGRPPVVEFDFEIDVRAVSFERVVL